MFEESTFPKPVPPENDETIKISTAEIDTTKNQSRGSMSEKSEVFGPKEKLISTLEQEGFLNIIDGHIVLDLDFIKSPDLKRKLKNTNLDKKTKKSFTANNVFAALRNTKVVSREDFERQRKNGEPIKSKPLFNIPKSIEDAFDEESIRSKEYYLNLWDLYEDEGQNRMHWKQDIITENGEAIGAREMAMAVKIFRDFQGKRDENGNLMVYDEEKNEFRKISARWIEEKIGSMGGSQGTSLFRPFEFFQKFCPNLIQKGMIKLEDFRIKTEGASGKLMRKEFDMANKTYVPIDSNRYYIGIENFIFNRETIPMQNIKVVILDKNTAGIVTVHSKTQKILYTFNLLSPEEKEQKRKRIKEKHPDFSEEEVTDRSLSGKGEMEQRMCPWQRTEENPRLKGEAENQYAERMSLLGDYNFLKEISLEFAEKAGIGIHDVLTWREQQWLNVAAYKLKTLGKFDQLLDFVKHYQGNGLRAFLSCEFDINNAQKIVAIGEELSFEDASLIFSKISELVDLAEKKKADLERLFFKDGEARNVSGMKFEMLQRIQEIIKQFGDGLKVKGEKKEKIKNLLDEIKKSKVGIILLQSVLRSAKEGEEEIDFENIKDFDIETNEMGEDLRQEEKERILGISKKNYYDIVFPGEPEKAKVVVDGLEKEMISEEGLKNQKTYTLKYKGEIVAFCKFRPVVGKPDELEFTSVNISSELHGLKIGEYFISKVMEIESKNYIINGDTFVKNTGANKLYFEKVGFENLGEYESEKYLGEKLYKMRMDKREK
ncbi:MAG: GNAT family N-acetyltransferase [Parcubacteria group bacterium]|jgi:hypothetical protein